MSVKSIFAVMVCFLMIACSETESGSPALRQAVKASANMLLSKNLSRSAFYAAYPDGQASDYVDYYFSAMGTAEWPPHASEFSKDELQAARIDVLPDNVTFSPNQRDTSVKGMQVVIKADDDKGVVIFEGYQKPSETPDIVVEKELIKVEPSELARMTFESNREMGVDY